MRMTIPEGLPPAVQLLPPSDQQRYLIDLQAYGFAMVRSNDDGTVTYIPPSVWLQHRESWRRRAYFLNMTYAIARSVAIGALVMLGVFVVLGLLEPPK